MTHNANLASVLRDRYEPALDRPFLRVPGENTRTYRDMDTRAAVFAAALSETGVRPGDRVVVQVEKSPDAIALYLACLRGGFVYVPLNPAYTPAEVAYFVSDAEPAALVHRPAADASLVDAAKAAHVGAVLTLGNDGDGSLGQIEAEPDHDIVRRHDEDLAAVLYTSGTTGRSKGAMLTHRSLRVNAFALHEVWGFVPGDVLLHILPIFHVHGLFVAMHCAMLNGSEVIFCRRFDPATVTSMLSDATVMMGVPTHYGRLLDHPDLDADHCRNIRLFTSGSAPLSETVFAGFTDRTGHAIVERYGMTEVGILTSNPLAGDRIAGTVGYPLPGVDIRVVHNGTIAAPATIGTVETRGDNMFSGYWRRPDETASELTDDGWFRTGDLGSLDADGRLTLVGRSADLIISGGLNVYPKEVERCLDNCESVAESAVVGVADVDLGETVVAYVVPESGATISVPDLTAACHATLARFKHPRRIVVVDELPRNAMGKVQKAALRAEPIATTEE